MSFYVTLPSNASTGIFPNNKPGHFFVKLPQPIDLTTQYEVGLVEIQFPDSYFNVLLDDIWVQYFPPGSKEPSLKLTLKPGLYKSQETFIDELNQLILEADKAGKSVMRFYFDRTSRKVKFKLFEAGAKVKLSDPLQYMLSLPKAHASDEDPVLVGEEEVVMDSEMNQVYVYCDLVASRVVGDAMVPLLRMVPIVDRSSASVFRIYDKPHYVALSRFSFDVVEILLTNDTGKTIPFVNGTSVLTLHFRTRRRFDIE